MYGVKVGKDYPAPIVDHNQAYRAAKEEVFKWRKKPIVRELAQKVYEKHGSRENQFFPSQHRKLFGNFQKSGG